MGVRNNFLIGLKVHFTEQKSSLVHYLSQNRVPGSRRELSGLILLNKTIKLYPTFLSSFPYTPASQPSSEVCYFVS